METGETVILLNLENLYESLYDALNQVCIFMFVNISFTHILKQMVIFTLTFLQYNSTTWKAVQTDMWILALVLIE